MLQHTDLRSFITILGKRKKLLLTFFLLSMALAAAVTYGLAPTYEADAKILVKIGRENVFFPSAEKSYPVVSIDNEQLINTEIEILMSLSLAEEVVAAVGPGTIYPKLNSSAAKHTFGFGLRAPKNPPSRTALAALQLQKNLEVASIRKSNVIDAGFRHRDPEIAARVVNQLVQAYVDRHLKIHKNPESSEFFREQANLFRKKVAEAQQSLKDFKSRYDITSIEEERVLLLTEEAKLRAALNETLIAEAEMANQLPEIQAQLSAAPKTIPQSREVDPNPYAISAFEGKLVELELKEKDLARRYTDENRALQGVRNEIVLLQKRLAEQKAQTYGKSTFTVNPTYQILQDEFIRKEIETRALRARKELQTTQLGDIRGRIDKLNLVETELQRLSNQAELAESSYRLYLGKYEESRISDAMDTQKITNVSIIEPAQVPVKPIRPRPALNLALGFMLGILGGVCLAFTLELMGDSINEPEELEEAAGIPALASISEIHLPPLRR